MSTFSDTEFTFITASLRGYLARLCAQIQPAPITKKEIQHVYQTLDRLEELHTEAVRKHIDKIDQLVKLLEFNEQKALGTPSGRPLTKEKSP
jgi:hypothetical protein